MSTCHCPSPLDADPAAGFDRFADDQKLTAIRLTALTLDGRRPPDTGPVYLGRGVIAVSSVPAVAFDPMHPRHPVSITITRGMPRMTARVLMRTPVCADQVVTAGHGSWLVETFAVHPELGAWAATLPRLIGELEVMPYPSRRDAVLFSLAGPLWSNAAVFPLEDYPTADPTAMVVTATWDGAPAWVLNARGGAGA